MNIVGQFPRRVEEVENLWIELSDGCRLAARMWLPVDAKEDPVPAILEYLPYRKRDGTAERDELTHPYFAGHGYACVRVDMRGNGESDGLMWDEYLKQEQDDALEVIDWLTQQPWCDGKVGMIGISWGGFNGLQVAARRPPALKAIVTICSTDDRYADDIHYKGGALLNENLGWAATMFSYSSRPPDPALVGERWRAMWLERLENTPLLVENWLRHPHRDAYWKHGSVCEDLDAIEAAVFAVGGWGDAYSNAVPRLLRGLKAPVRGLVGPWVHKYPHFATPEPAIGFLQESLRWWDQWLKGVDTGIMQAPLYRAYLQDSVAPQASYTRREGRWICESQWPSPNIEERKLWLNAGALAPEPSGPVALELCSPQDTGVACGEFCAMWLGPDFPTDQRIDDAGSLVFDTPPLEERIDMFGAPRVGLELVSNRPQAFVVVRLCDVAPDGASTRVSFGVLNLTHRKSHETPTALVPGQRYTVSIELDDAAWVFPPGNRIRIAVSNAYWPMLWPSPEAATLSVQAGASHLLLPVRKPTGDPACRFESPESAPPMAVEWLRNPAHERTVEYNVANGETQVHIRDDFGSRRILTHGLVEDSVSSEVYRIHRDDPLCASVAIRWTQCLSRDAWQSRTETTSRMWADAAHFYIEARLEAFAGEERVFARDWKRKIPRDLV